VKKLIMVAALAMCAYGSSALAAGGYVRGEFGNSDVNIDVDGLGDDSDNDNAYVLGGGYYFNDNFAIDGFYGNLYDSNDVTLHAVGLGLVGKHNFGGPSKGFYLSGRAGIARMVGEADGFDSESDTNVYFGVGAGWDFNENVGLGVNYTRYNSDFDGISVDANTFTAALEFRF
jgi:OOP family OmpA-OmpF porin